MSQQHRILCRSCGDSATVETMAMGVVPKRCQRCRREERLAKVRQIPYEEIAAMETAIAQHDAYRVAGFEAKMKRETRKKIPFSDMTLRDQFRVQKRFARYIANAKLEGKDVSGLKSRPYWCAAIAIVRRGHRRPAQSGIRRMRNTVALWREAMLEEPLESNRSTIRSRVNPTV